MWWVGRKYRWSSSERRCSGARPRRVSKASGGICKESLHSTTHSATHPKIFDHFLALNLLVNDVDMLRTREGGNASSWAQGSHRHRSHHPTKSIPEWRTECVVRLLVVRRGDESGIMMVSGSCRGSGKRWRGCSPISTLFFLVIIAFLILLTWRPRIWLRYLLESTRLVAWKRLRLIVTNFRS